MKSASKRIAVLAILAIGLGSAVSCGQGSQSPYGREAGVLYVPPPMAAGANDVLNAGQTQPNSAVQAGGDVVWQRMIATHAALIGNRTRLAKAIANPNSEIRKTQWYTRFKNPSDAVDSLARNIHVSPVSGTALIEIRFDGDADPKEANAIIMQIGNQYLEDNHSIMASKLVDQVTVLTNLKNRWDIQIRDARLKLAKIVASDTLDTPTDRPLTPAELADARARKMEIDNLHDELNSLKTLWDRARDRLDQLNMMMTQGTLTEISWAVRPGAL